MDNNQLAAAFNEWMRLTIESPADFEQQWQSVVAFIDDGRDGVVPSYGERCAAFLTSLLTQVPS